MPCILSKLDATKTAVWSPEQFPKFFNAKLIELLKLATYGRSPEQDTFAVLKMWILPEECWFKRRRRVLVIDYYSDDWEKYHHVAIVALDHKDKLHLVKRIRHKCFYNERKHCELRELVLPKFCMNCGTPFMKPKKYRGKKPRCMNCRA